MNSHTESGSEEIGLAQENSNTAAQVVSNELFVKVVTENYSEYIKKCHAFLQCSSLAEDAVQEGVLAAHCNLDSIRDSSALGAWLHRIVIRKAIDLLRKNKRFPSFEDDLEELVSYSKYGLLNAPLWAEIIRPEEEILKKEGLEQIKKSLESLSDVHRIPLLLKDFEGFSVKEISEILKISEANTKVRIHRGRIKLKNKLSGYFFPEQLGGVE